MSSPPLINVDSSGPTRPLDETQPTKPINMSELEDTLVTKPLPTINVDHTEPFIEIAQRCDTGGTRSRNEDSTFNFVALSGGENPNVPIALSIVADGMGGHADGHEASRTVCNYVGQYILSRVFLPLFLNEPVSDPIQDIIKQGVIDAGRIIHTTNVEAEGGTTLTSALIIKSRLFLAHIGDSRAYLITEESFEQLTTDHSVVQRLIDTGQISEEEAEEHPHRNLLYRAITGEKVEIDFITRPLPKSGYLLLCSDGLWGSISQSQITTLVRDNRIDTKQKCNQLVKTALQQGSTDNVTGALVHFKL